MQSDEKEEGKNDIAAMLRVIQSEYSQLSELTDVEAQDTRTLVSGLRVLQSAVERLIPIRKELLGGAFDGVSDAYLASECVLLVRLEDGTMASRSLHDLPARAVLPIVQDCLPELGRLISEHRRDVHERINLLERALKELKRTESALRLSKDGGAAEQEDDDLMRRSLTTG